MANIALLGGAFDPIHNGHLAIALHALNAFALDQVRIIPCASPVHKMHCQASQQQRAAMIALAIEHQPGLVLDTCELERNSPSYAIDTIEQLIATHGSQHHWYWLLGSDALLSFKTWRRWQDILSVVDLIVVNREGATTLTTAIAELNGTAQAKGHVVHYCDMPLQPQASTLIRRQANANNDVPAAVARYIEQQKLYR